MGDFGLSIFHRKLFELHVYKVDHLSFNIKRDSFGANGAKKLLDWNYFSLFTMIKCIWRKIRIFANLLINTYFLWCPAQYIMFEQKNLNKQKYCHLNKLVGRHTSTINTILMFEYLPHPSSSPPLSRIKPPESCNENALILGVFLLKTAQISHKRCEIYWGNHLQGF